jgi:hypothetical protein
VVKQLSLFILSYFVFVTLSTIIFGVDYSRNSGVYEGGLEKISLLILLFYFPFLYVLRAKLHWSSCNKMRHNKINITNESLTMIVMLPFIIFLIHYGYNTGFRLTGDFLDHVGERSTVTDYFFVYFVCMVSLFPKSRIVVLMGCISVFLHIIAAERMRAFVYIVVLGIHLFDIENRKYIASMMLSLGFVLATIIGSLRSLGGPTSEYNVTHFGSVTVSSLHLLNYSSLFEWTERVKFLLGMIAANIIPSSLIADEFNIRKDILNFADIPGGGWLPVYFFTVGGSYIFVLLAGFLVALVYRNISKLFMSNPSPATYALLLTFVSTTPRWFMYSPFQVVKMPLYAFAGVVVISLLLGSKRYARSTF